MKYQISALVRGIVALSLVGCAMHLSAATNIAGGNIGGTLTQDTVLNSNGVFTVTSSLTVPSGITLTIQPGAVVQFGSGLNLSVSSGGIIAADGTSNAPIHFTRSGTSGNWGSITINGALGSPESRITYADFAFNANNVNTPCIEVNAGAAFLNHLVFSNTAAPYIHVDGASFIISDCFFPQPAAAFEPCHGTRGVRRDGHGFFLRNYFGKPNNYNDVVDFTGGNRPYPIVHFIDNVVMGGDDDGFDIDGTDAWIEHNIFVHMHKNGATPDSASGISGGSTTYASGDPGGTGTETSEITIVGNIFFDCDQAVASKEGNFFTLINNTVLHQNHTGGIDSTGAVMICADTGTPQGNGFYVEGNIIQDIEQLVRNQTTAVVTFSNNILPVAWSGPGGANSITNALFNHVPQTSETFFTNWAQAQVMWTWLALQSNSPAIGTGPNGVDKGAVIPIGASVSGAPSAPTSQSNATLVVGFNRSGSGIPVAGWPLGAGYTAYKWRLDNGAWSAETPIASPIVLSNLAAGSHFVEVTGKRDSGVYQDDPLNGADATVTRTPAWTITAGSGISDRDGDGMPDDWELAHGLNPDNAADAVLDPDGDGMTNLQEYLAGTDPRDPASRLSVQISRAATNVVIAFAAASNKTYTVQYRTAFSTNTPWLRLQDVAPAASRIVAVTNATDKPASFFRIVTPAAP